MGLTLRNYDHLTWKLAPSYDAQARKLGPEAVSDAGLQYERASKKFASGLKSCEFRLRRRFDHDFGETLERSPRNSNHDIAKLERANPVSKHVSGQA
jgi:hypothetical protein